MKILISLFSLIWLVECGAEVFNGQKIVPGELILKLKSSSNWSILKSRLSVKTQLAREIRLTSEALQVINFKKDRPLKNIIKEIKASGLVERVSPNFIYEIVKPQVRSVYPKDPKGRYLWGLKNNGNNEPLPSGGTNSHAGVIGADIGAVEAWKVTKGERNIKIAIIDTGIDYNHEDLKENMWINEAEKNGKAGVDDDGNGYVDDIYGYDFSSDNGDSDPWDDNGHGTHCAGTIGAVHNNQLGIAGVMANVSLVAVKFLTAAGSGTTEGAIKAIDYATSVGVDIMSNSWGGGAFDENLKAAIETAHEKGIIFVAAAGNESLNTDVVPHYPSNYDIPNVISVGSHTAQDRASGFSNTGKSTVMLMAPGSNIMSTLPNNRYGVYSGTSMATPHVSGALGLLLSKTGPLSFDELRKRLIMTTIPLKFYKRKNISGGRLNAYNLVIDKRIPRDTSEPGTWTRLKMKIPFESKHPYPNGKEIKKSIHVPNAKFIRVVVEKLDLEKAWDYISVVDPLLDDTVQKLTGQMENVTSEYVEGDTLELIFQSDQTINGWGFRIKQLDYSL